jgi:hypothetical protein
MLAARSIAFAAVSASAVSARELAIAPAPSKAAHVRNEPLPRVVRAPYLPRPRLRADDAHDVAEGGARDRAFAGDCRGGVRARNADGLRAACPAAARLQHRARGPRAWFTPFWLLNIKRV